MLSYLKKKAIKMTPFGRAGKNADAPGLNGPADRNYALSNQFIKGRQNAFIPDIR